MKMNNKNLIIVIESIILVILIGFLIYGYNQYKALNGNYNTLEANHNTLTTEFDSFTDFGTAKIKLPIDSDYELILVVQNSMEYKKFLSEQSEVERIGDYGLYFSITSPQEGRSRYAVLVQAINPLNELFLTVDAETGEIISSDS